jgi:hypothetical protein
VSLTGNAAVDAADLGALQIEFYYFVRALMRMPSRGMSVYSAHDILPGAARFSRDRSGRDTAEELELEESEYAADPLENYATWRRVNAKVTYGQGVPRPVFDPADEEYW